MRNKLVLIRGMPIGTVFRIAYKNRVFKRAPNPPYHRGCCWNWQGLVWGWWLPTGQIGPFCSGQKGVVIKEVPCRPKT